VGEAGEDGAVRTAGVAGVAGAGAGAGVSAGVGDRALGTGFPDGGNGGSGGSGGSGRSDRSGRSGGSCGEHVVHAFHAELTNPVEEGEDTAEGGAHEPLKVFGLVLKTLPRKRSTTTCTRAPQRVHSRVQYCVHISETGAKIMFSA
jgi:hypothetical protein